MLGKGKDKKLIEAIAVLRDVENPVGSPELVSIHSRLLSGRTAFEGILTKTMTSAMSISNLDLQVSDRVEIILHPERFPERDPQRAALRAVEDSVEQNDNSFDGLINNIAQPDPAEAIRQQARESAAAEERHSVLEALKARQAEAAKAAEKAEAEARKQRPRLPRDEEVPVRI